MPAMMTMGGPFPRSTIFMASVSQRPSGLQGVLNALLGPALAHEAEERLALEIKQLLFGDRRRMRQHSSSHDGGERPADLRVVVANPAGPPRKVDAQLQRGQHRVAAYRNRRSRQGRMVPLADPLQSPCLRVLQQTVAVHGEGVGGPKVAQP